MIDPFEYQPPNAVTAPKYAAIREAEAFAATEIEDAAAEVNAGRAMRPDAFARINAATKALYDTIERECSPCADTAAALRCVRIARMAANEAIVAVDRDSPLRQAFDNLRAARWQACAAVALNTPTPET